MRDRLVELLNFIQCKADCCGALDGGRCGALDKLDRCQIETIADHLIANGVIVPPCKVGDTVYWLNFYNDLMLYRDKYYEAEVTRIVVTKYGVSCVIRVRGEHATYEIPDVEFGKTVFLTREEAEQALKGGAE
ncbi:MAG: hypothetical protein J6S14_04185 [Clostridia bacterium]|nr:hypothetical protein [Clostridia bacterium]